MNNKKQQLKKKVTISMNVSTWNSLHDKKVRISTLIQSLLDDFLENDGIIN